MSKSPAFNIYRTDERKWFEGPDFSYVLSASRQKDTIFKVHVPGSSWPLRGSRMSSPVLDIIARSKGGRLLDFGAGSWLRYPQHILKTSTVKEVIAVEYDQAFREDALVLYKKLEALTTIWSPSTFQVKKNTKYDMILLVNVLNTIPEALHRGEIFALLAKRLNPLGLLVLYQRVWAPSEPMANPIPYYDDGWFVGSSKSTHPHYTYRARTGAQWFTQQAAKLNLKLIDTGVHFTSNNTLLKVWEKPFK